MRERLIRSTLLICAMIVLALGLPLAVLARTEVTSTAQEALQQEVDTLVASLEDQIAAGTPIPLRRVEQVAVGRRVTITTARGQRTVFGSARARATRRAVAAVPGVTVVLEDLSTATDVRARNITLAVLALAVVVTVAAVCLSVRQAKQFSAPLAALAARADALGRGDFSAPAARSGLPEVDDVAGQLEASARQIGVLVGLQRDFAADVAHQLRTPLTGISLRLEEIAQLSEGSLREEANLALDQLERLELVVGSLLSRAMGDGIRPEPFDLAELVDADAHDWREALDRLGRSLVLDLEQPVPVFARRAQVSTVLASLLENALGHGAGTVTVTVRPTSPTRARFSVTDEGDGIPSSLIDRVFDRSVSDRKGGTGIGLALARSLVADEGGEIALAPALPTTFVVDLPAAAAEGLGADV